VSLVKARWNEKRAELTAVRQFIETRAAALSAAQRFNFIKWPILSTIVWVNPQAAGSYQGEVDYLRTWLEQHWNWLDGAINGL
jgi:hypothetical protein